MPDWVFIGNELSLLLLKPIISFLHFANCAFVLSLSACIPSLAALNDLFTFAALVWL